MPLPAALQARLLKRGILKAEDIKAAAEEEIIAEDYDDQHKDGTNKEGKAETTKADKEDAEHEKDKNKENNEALGCPNKWNIYHDCTPFCHTQWGLGKREPDPKMDRKRLKILAKYPLPDCWQEAYDPGCCRYYYWNTITENVSWLPPSHPKAKVSVSAAILRAQVKAEAKARELASKVAEEKQAAAARDQSNSDDDDSDDDRRRRRERDYRSSRRWDRDRERERERARDRSRERNSRRANERERRRDKTKNNDLDPMDPAAYSDIPRGTWSTGLEGKGEAKTGVDTTASGPLFQMRPYPSPGDILRANASSGSKKKPAAANDDDSD